MTQINESDGGDASAAAGDRIHERGSTLLTDLSSIRMDDLIKIAMDIVDEDNRRTAPLIAYFLANNFSGGWESWLQAEYARKIGSIAVLADFNREVAYPGIAPVKKSDLWFKAARGADLWVELKAQRRQNYVAAFTDFQSDVNKIVSLGKPFLQANVNAAIVVLACTVAYRGSLAAYKATRPAGTLKYKGLIAGKWTDVYDNVDKVPLGTPIVASWIPTTL